MTWQERAEQAKRTCSWTETARIIRDEYFQHEDIGVIHNRVRSHLRKHGKVQPKQSEPIDLLAMLKKGANIDDITEKGVTERVALAMIDDLRDQGHCIDEYGGMYVLSKQTRTEPKVVTLDWRGDKILRFGTVSDVHMGSKFVQIGALHEAYDTFQREGITDVYNPGDLSEGEKMRPGHEYECYVHGADAHVDEIEKNYPQRDGITTHFVLGNHDLSFVKHVGLDIGKTIAKQRADMDYLGPSQAYIDLTPKCRLELRHPGGGSAYAISYKTQKMVDAMSGGEKPAILVIGHYHKAEYIFYRNVQCIQAGTIQAQSNFMRDNNIAAHVGYWIITAHVDDDGQINRFIPEFFPFYRMVKDDWKNYR